MKTIIPIMLIGLFALSSISSLAQDFKEQQEFNVYNDGQISFNQAKLHYYNMYEIVEGEHIVIEYITDNGGDPGNHSKAKTVIAFQIEKGSKTFELSDQEIESHGGIYMQACECQDIGIHPVSNGSIKGRLNKNGSWTVDMNISVKGRVTGKQYVFEFSNDYNLVKN